MREMEEGEKSAGGGFWREGSHKRMDRDWKEAERKSEKEEEKF